MLHPRQTLLNPQGTTLVAEGLHHNLTYTVIKQDLGHLCGYVTVPTSHLAYRISTLSVLSGFIDFETYLQPHGGLTYNSPETDAVGFYNNGWTFGFDCAHADDSNNPDDPGYRNLEYVKANCIIMAEQLKDLPAICQNKLTTLTIYINKNQ